MVKSKKKDKDSWITISFPRPILMKRGQSFEDLPLDIQEQVFAAMKEQLKKIHS